MFVIMGKIKAFIKARLNGEHGGFWTFATFSTCFLLLSLLFSPGNNLIHWAQARMEISRQQKRIEYYETEIAAMNDSIRLLRSNRDSLEKYARETFHFAAPGDDVYLVED